MSGEFIYILISLLRVLAACNVYRYCLPHILRKLFHQENWACTRNGTRGMERVTDMIRVL